MKTSTKTKPNIITNTTRFDNGNYGIEYISFDGDWTIAEFTTNGDLVSIESNVESDETWDNNPLPKTVEISVMKLFATNVYNKYGLNALNSFFKDINCIVSIVEFGFGESALERKKEWLNNNTKNNVIRVHYYSSNKSSRNNKVFKGNLIRGKKFVFNL